MKDASIVSEQGILRSVADYIDVLKPRETILLTFIGLCAAFAAAYIATSDFPDPSTFLLAFVAILISTFGFGAAQDIYFADDFESHRRG